MQHGTNKDPRDAGKASGGTANDWFGVADMRNPIAEPWFGYVRRKSGVRPFIPVLVPAPEPAPEPKPRALTPLDKRVLAVHKQRARVAAALAEARTRRTAR